MAWYIDRSTLTQSDGAKSWWTTDHGPAQTVPVSGIYKCVVCKKEVTSNKGDPFPPQNHHQHDPGQGPVSWRLNVRSNTDGV